VRLANVLVTGTLFTAVIAEGAYIIKTHRQMEALTTQVQQLAAEGADEPSGRELSRQGGWVGDRPTAGAPGKPARLPPPRFATTSAPAPSGPSGSTSGLALPAALDTPEARDQLRQFVAAELQRERDDFRQQQQQAREDEARRRLDEAIKTLGLSSEDGKRLTDVVTKAQDQRRELRDKIQSGQLARADVGKEMNALRVETDKQIRSIVGDDKAQKFQELQRQNRGPGPGGPGFGGPGFGGPGFGGPGFGGPGGPPAGPPP
jgi:hypothetical protein